MPDSQHTALSRSILKSLLGLSPKTTRRVMSAIEASPDIAQLKNQMIRRRIGPRSMDHLRRAIDVSGEGGSIRPEEKKKEGEKEDKVDKVDKVDKKVDKDAGVVSKETNKKLEESITFKSFLFEISAEQAARMSVTDQQTRKDAAMKTNRNATQDLAKDITDMEQSTDPDEKKLAMLVKQEAMLRQKIKNKRSREVQG